MYFAKFGFELADLVSVKESLYVVRIRSGMLLSAVAPSKHQETTDVQWGAPEDRTLAAKALRCAKFGGDMDFDGEADCTCIADGTL